METLVGELLRKTPSTPISFPRVATDDLVPGGTTVRQAEAVIVSLLHCNHFPGLRLAPGDGALVWREGLATRAVSRLVVEW